MKTVAPPLAVTATHGSRIRLADGRELIDGIASWWTACHGYNHPHIRAAVERQLGADAPRHVRRPGARTGADLGAAAGWAARAGRSRPRVLQRVRFGRGRSRAENGGAILAQPGQAKPHPFPRLHAAAITATPPAPWRYPTRRAACTRRSAGCCPSRSRSICRSTKQARRPLKLRLSGMPTSLPPSSSSRWCRAPAACGFTMRRCCARCAPPPIATNCC